MAGELLLRMFDEARFAELKPAFAELRQGKVLSSAALNAIRGVLDQAVLDEPWYEDLVSGGSAHSYDLRIPVEGCDAILPNPSVKEVHAKLVTLHGAAATKQRLNDLGAQTGMDPLWIMSEVEQFLRLLKKATSADRWGLAHQILL